MHCTLEVIIVEYQHTSSCNREHPPNGLGCFRARFAYRVEHRYTWFFWYDVHYRLAASCCLLIIPPSTRMGNCGSLRMAVRFEADISP
jgi:hypothetical protein